MAETEYRTLSAADTVALLRENVPTLILYHARPDADAVGSAYALSLWLGKMGIPAYCLCVDEIPKRLRFLTNGLQESALMESLPADFSHARVITVDTPSIAQLGGLFEVLGDRIVLMIDHHKIATVYADHYRVITAAATGEIIFDLMREAGVEIDVQIATLLYAAISGDTGCFRYSNVTRNTHLVAASLVEMGIDAAEINRQLFDSKPLSLLRAERAGFDRISFYEDGKIAVLTFPFALKAELGLSDEDLETLIDVARGVAGVEIAAAIRQPKNEGVFRLSMRASVDFDVAAICAEFGGGGHTRAAGATVLADTVEDATRAVLDAILRAR